MNGGQEALSKNDNILFDKIIEKRHLWSMDMNLEQYRASEGISYRQLGLRIGAVAGCRITESQVQAYCRGERWPRPRRVEAILLCCRNVTLHALYEAHLSYVKSMIPEKGKNFAPDSLELTSNGGQ